MRKMLWVLALACVGPASAELTTLWTRTFGGASNDGARAIDVTLDGGYVLVGYTYSFGAGDGDIYLIKTDPTGREQWSRVYGGPGRDYGYGVGRTSDGGCVLTGTTIPSPGEDRDVYVARVDAAGGQVWARTYGGAETDEGWAIRELSDGTLLVAGRTESRGAGGSDFYVLRLEADGDTLWTRTFGGAEWDWATSVCETSDGNYAVVGTSGSASGNRDVWAVKIMPDGDEIWARAYGSLVAADADWGWAVRPTDAGGLVITGHGNDHALNDAGDVWLIRADSAGEVDWAYTYGGTNYYEHGHGLCATADGGYLVCGIKKDPTTQRNDLLLVKTDGEGNEQWIQCVAGAAREWASGIVTTSPGRYTVAGFTDGAGAGRFDMWLVNLVDPTSQDVIPADRVPLRLDAPNVIRGEAEIRFGLPEDGGARLAILDVAGREVARVRDGDLRRGEHTSLWQAGKTPAGVYYCVLTTGGRQLARRMTLLR